MNDDLIIEQLRMGPLWNFSYLVGSRAAGEAAVIDPGVEPRVLLERAAEIGVRVVAVVATHFHKDHTAGVEMLEQQTSAVVRVHYADEAGLRSLFQGPLRATDDMESIQIGNHHLRLWHAPGHTPGSQWIVVDGSVFTGDSLMVGCVGRTGYEDNAMEQMWWTFSERFPLLEDDVRIYPGHDYGPAPWSTVGRERQRNASLRASTIEEFAHSLDAYGQG
jgi:glyoxylase-like metal-dependent hydrolase (beta-lactamase superfamily II)